jgi:putative oxidoreductase
VLHADHSPLAIAGHVFIALLFIIQGLGALPRERFAFHTKRLRERLIPGPAFVLICGLAMMLAGGLMVMLDIYAQVGARMLIVFTVVATLLFQNFWTISDPVRRREKRGTFFNNLAVLGGLLLLVA